MAAKHRRGSGLAVTVAWAAISLAIMFVLANAGAWIAFRLFPDRILSANIRTTYDFFARYDGELARYREDWFGLKPGGWPQYVAEIKDRIARGGNVYEDFTMFKPVPSSGTYVNFPEAGYRSVGADLQGAWPIDPANYNVFFFGGSTAMGVASDLATIAHYLQPQLEAARPARPVRVYNFGRGSYFSIQDSILFQNLLRSGAKPDLAVFLHGLNDLFFLDGRPSAWNVYDAALQDHARRVREQVAGITELRPRWSSLQEFALSLPLVKLAGAIGGTSAQGSATAYQPLVTDPAQLRQAIQRYRATARLIQAIADGSGVKVALVIQPVPGYHYDLKKHIALDPRFGLGGHERSGQGYPMLLESLQREPLGGSTLIWAADTAQDYPEAAYLDAVHYTRGFSEALAKHIAAELGARGLLD